MSKAPDEQTSPITTQQAPNAPDEPTKPESAEEKKNRLIREKLCEKFHEALEGFLEKEIDKEIIMHSLDLTFSLQNLSYFYGQIIDPEHTLELFDSYQILILQRTLQTLNLLETKAIIRNGNTLLGLKVKKGFKDFIQKFIQENKHQEFGNKFFIRDHKEISQNLLIVLKKLIIKVEVGKTVPEKYFYLQVNKILNTIKGFAISLDEEASNIAGDLSYQLAAYHLKLANKGNDNSYKKAIEKFWDTINFYEKIINTAITQCFEAFKPTNKIKYHNAERFLDKNQLHALNSTLIACQELVRIYMTSKEKRDDQDFFDSIKCITKMNYIVSGMKGREAFDIDNKPKVAELRYLSTSGKYSIHASDAKLEEAKENLKQAKEAIDQVEEAKEAIDQLKEAKEPIEQVKEAKENLNQAKESLKQAKKSFEFFDKVYNEISRGLKLSRSETFELKINELKEEKKADESKILGILEKFEEFSKEFEEFLEDKSELKEEFLELDIKEELKELAQLKEGPALPEEGPLEDDEGWNSGSDYEEEEGPLEDDEYTGLLGDQ